MVERVVKAEIINDDSKLLFANSTINAIFELGMILGMSFGGLAISFLDIHILFIVVLALNILACIANYLIRTKKHPIKSPKSFIKSWIGVYNYLKVKKFLWCYFIAQVLLTAIFMTAPTFIAPYTKNILNGSSFDFGIIETGLSAGFIIGNLTLSA